MSPGPLSSITYFIWKRTLETAVEEPVNRAADETHVAVAAHVSRSSTILSNLLRAIAVADAAAVVTAAVAQVAAICFRLVPFVVISSVDISVDPAVAPFAAKMNKRDTRLGSKTQSVCSHDRERKKERKKERNTDKK